MQGILLRAVFAAICLLPPTHADGRVAAGHGALGGGDSAGRFLARASFTAETSPGAVFGCLLAGFYLLRVYDMPIATFVAAAINGVRGVDGLHAGEADGVPARRRSPAGVKSVAEVCRASGPAAVYVAIALSGMSALGAEVVWTRLLSLMIGATVYTFSIILAVFLMGLGIGSSGGAVLARSRSRAASLGLVPDAPGGAIAWTAFMLADSMPYWP